MTDISHHESDTDSDDIELILPDARPETTMMLSLETLPLEIKFKIFGYLDGMDHIHLALTSPVFFQDIAKMYEKLGQLSLIKSDFFCHNAATIYDLMQQKSRLSRENLDTIVTLGQVLSLDEMDSTLLRASQLLISMKDLEHDLYRMHIGQICDSLFPDFLKRCAQAALLSASLGALAYPDGLLMVATVTAYLFGVMMLMYLGFCCIAAFTPCCQKPLNFQRTNVRYLEISDPLQLTDEDQTRLSTVFENYVVTETSPPIAEVLSTYIKTGLHGLLFDHIRVNHAQITDDTLAPLEEIVIIGSDSEADTADEDASLAIHGGSLTM